MIVYALIMSLLGLSACCCQKKHTAQPQMHKDVSTQAYESDDYNAKEIGISDDEEDLFIDDMPSEQEPSRTEVIEVFDMTDKSMDEEFPEMTFEEAISVIEFEQ